MPPLRWDRLTARASRAAAALLGGALLAAAPLAAQYPLAPSPVLDIGRLAPAPRLSGYLAARQTVRRDSMTFTVSRARLTAQARPTPYLAVRVQGDLAGIGRTTSSGAVPAFVLTDAYAELVPGSGALARALRPSLLVGQFKMPFSLEYLTPYSHLLTIDRSRAVDALSPKRDIGIMAQAHVTRYAVVDAAVANGSGPNATSNPDGREIAMARVTIMPVPHVALAGKWAVEGADHRWGYDARVIAGRATLEGEVVRRVHPGGAANADASGGYLLASFKLAPWLQPVVKWEQLRQTTDAVPVPGESRSTWTTYGVNLDAVHDRVRLQLDWIVKSDHPVEHANELLAQFIAIY